MKGSLKLLYRFTVEANDIAYADDVTNKNTILWVEFYTGRVAFAAYSLHGLTPKVVRDALVGPLIVSMDPRFAVPIWIGTQPAGFTFGVGCLSDTLMG